MQDLHIDSGDLVSTLEFIASDRTTSGLGVATSTLELCNHLALRKMVSYDGSARGGGERLAAEY